MAEEEEVPAEEGPLPTLEQVAGVYGGNPGKDVEGNHYEFSIIQSEEEGSAFVLKHKSCFIPSAGAPFAGTWVTKTDVLKGTWTLAEGPPLAAPVEDKSEEKTEDAPPAEGEEAPAAAEEEGKEGEDAPAEEAPVNTKPTAEITLQCATKELEDVEDGAFVRNDQPCTRYTWKFRVSEDQTSLTLLDSNYPVNLTSARWEQGSSIEMKYLDLVLLKA